MAEVQASFASPRHSPVRRHIFFALVEHLDKALVKDLVAVLLIDGGFTSSKPEPKDVDVVLGVIPGTMDILFAGRLGVSAVSAIALLEGKLSPTVEGHRLIDGFVDDIGGPKYEGMRHFFQRSDRLGEPSSKGLLRVTLK